jgi:hypothetical protein
MAMERMRNIGMPPSIGRFRPEQIAQQSTWTVVPENQRTSTSMHIKHIVPSNGSTTTYVNLLDNGYDYYREMPGYYGTVHHAGIWR